MTSSWADEDRDASGRQAPGRSRERTPDEWRRAYPGAGPHQPPGVAIWRTAFFGRRRVRRSHPDWAIDCWVFSQERFNRVGDLWPPGAERRSLLSDAGVRSDHPVTACRVHHRVGGRVNGTAEQGDQGPDRGARLHQKSLACRGNQENETTIPRMPAIASLLRLLRLLLPFVLRRPGRKKGGKNRSDTADGESKPGDTGGKFLWPSTRYQRLMRFESDGATQRRHKKNRPRTHSGSEAGSRDYSLTLASSRNRQINRTHRDSR